MRLDEIPGLEAPKRAIEIALTDNHPIKFMGNGEADLLAKRSKELGLTAYSQKHCPCGYYGDPRQACICTPSQIRRWQALKKNSQSVDILIDSPTPEADKILNHRTGEKDEDIIKRASDAKKIEVSDELGKSEKEFMKAAMVKLNLDYSSYLIVIKLAQSIAKLAGSNVIKVNCLAEALQYRPRAL